MTNRLDRTQLVPGAIVMVGPSRLSSGALDRSLCDVIWRIEAATGDSILCRRMTKLVGYADVIILQFSNQAWWQAEHMLEAYLAAMKEVAGERGEAKVTPQKTTAAVV